MACYCRHLSQLFLFRFKCPMIHPSVQMVQLDYSFLVYADGLIHLCLMNFSVPINWISLFVSYGTASIVHFNIARPVTVGR